MRQLAHIFVLLLLWSCSTGPDSNPFNTDPVEEPWAHLTGFAAIHERILEPKCANPACHDGTFEPDFRTVEGSYNTLVYHPVVKNDADLSFSFRVVPNAVEESWLYQRLITSDDTLGQMPLYGQPLSNDELHQIKSWIEDGAKNTLGEVAVAPNEVPKFNWYAAFSGDVNWSNWNQNRIDETRLEWAAPFAAEAGDTIRLLLHMNDDLTETDALQNVIVHIGMSRDYSNTTAYPANYFTGDYWTLALPPNNFNPGDTAYFRVHFSDGNSSISSPEPTSPWWYIDHCSFYLY